MKAQSVTGLSIIDVAIAQMCLGPICDMFSFSRLMLGVLILWSLLQVLLLRE